MEIIDKEYTAHPFYGTRQMRNVLRRKGLFVNRKRIQRLMRKMGIQSVSPKPYTSKACPQNKIYPYLLRTLEITMPDQVWCSDLTYLLVQRGFVYLTAVMDWYSRYVLSWELSVTMAREFCIAALERSLRCHKAPEIFNKVLIKIFMGKHQRKYIMEKYTHKWQLEAKAYTTLFRRVYFVVPILRACVHFRSPPGLLENDS